MAAKDFDPQAFLMEFVGVWMSDAGVEQMAHTSSYTIKCSFSPEKQTTAPMNGEEGFVIDPKMAGNLTGFINHSCRPNAVFLFVSYIRELT